MSFFMDPSVTVGTKILEFFYIFMGFMSVYAGVRNLLDKTNKARYGTFVFWTALGIVIAFGRWIPAIADGVLIIIMVIPAIFRQVRKGSASDSSAPSTAEVAANFQRIGMRIFIPALCLGVFAIIGALIPSVSALTGCCIGVMIAAVILFASRMTTSRSYSSTIRNACCLPWVRSACCRCCWPVSARFSQPQVSAT